VWARLTALIGLEQMTLAVTVSTATRVAGINRRASRGQSDGLGRSSVPLQWPQHGAGVVYITRGIEIAGAIAAQVVPFRGDGVVFPVELSRPLVMRELTIVVGAIHRDFHVVTGSLIDNCVVLRHPRGELRFRLVQLPGAHL